MSFWERIITEDYDFNTDIIKTIGTTPVFNNENAARLYDAYVSSPTTKGVSAFYNEGQLMYAPGKHYGDNGLITNVTVNGRDVMTRLLNRDFVNKQNHLSRNKITVSSTGGTLDIKVLGEGSAGVDLHLNDSTGCNMFNTNKKNQTVSGELSIKQVIPPLGMGKTQETYTFKVTPRAGTGFYQSEDSNGQSQVVKTGSIEIKVYQFKSPKLSISSIASTIPNSVTSTTTTEVTGLHPDVINEKTITHITTIANASEYSNVFYNTKEKLDLADLITDSSVIKKMVLGASTEPECLSQIQVVDIESGYSGDVEVGMQFSGSYEKTKIVQKSIPLYIEEEECDDCDRELDVLTNKFELENTNDLIVGMSAAWTNEKGYVENSSIETIDSGVGITLAQHYIVDDKTEFTFVYKNGGLVEEVLGDTIKIKSGCIWFPKNQEITFTKGSGSSVRGSVVVDKSGGSTMVITTIIEGIRMGHEDVAIALDVNKFVSLTPNTVETKIVTTKDNPVSIDLVAGDTDYNSKEKGYVIIEPTRNGELVVKSAGLNTYVYTPNPGFRGLDEFTYRTTTGSGDALVEGEERTISIKIK
tara:strand:- start:385 stop:2136 length:1752 start_codon:yes stop_codon:yes gene_type:complete